MGSLALAYLAGLVTILNPCVLPLVPLVVGSALGRSRWGAAALVAGLVLSFSTIGLLVIAFGYSIGLDEGKLRTFAGVLLVAAGVILTWPRAQVALSMAGAPISNRANRALSKISGRGAAGQFLVGTLLGAAWAPCVGPTLGVAIAAASTGSNLAGAFGVFLVFGLGVATSMLAFAHGSRKALASRRTVAQAIATYGKPAFGVILVIVGGLMLTGLDRAMEAAVLEALPDWLARFTTRF